MSDRCRTNSYRVAVDEYEHRFVVDGKPADCVAVGLGGVAVDIDAVVAAISPERPSADKPPDGPEPSARQRKPLSSVSPRWPSLYDPEVGIREFNQTMFEPADSLAADSPPDRGGGSAGDRAELTDALTDVLPALGAGEQQG